MSEGGMVVVELLTCSGWHRDSSREGGHWREGRSPGPRSVM